MSYPILVAQYDSKHPGDRGICVECGAEATMDPSDGDLFDQCLECRHCGGGLTWKYAQADKCGGCGKLGYWDKVLDHCCSRACQLQAEYAATLKGAA